MSANGKRAINNRKTWINGAIWSSKELFISVPNTLITGYLAFYATDVLGMSATLIATVLLVTKLIDGVTDIMSGVIVDNTHTRWGKGRPYDWCIILTAISTILLFAAPKQGLVLQVISIAVMYTLNQAVFTTLLQTGDSIYLLRAFPEEKERNNVYSISLIVAQAIGLSFGVILPGIIGNAGTNHAEWIKAVAMITIPTALVGMIRFFFIKEHGVEEHKEASAENNKVEEKISLKDSLHAVIHNPYILILSLAIFIIVLSSGLMNTSMMYYFKYIVGNVDAMGTVMLGTYGALLMLIIFMPLANKFGKERMLKIGCCLTAAGMAMVMCGVAPISMFTLIYIFDIMDYGEWKTKKRVEGMYAVLPQFANKVAGGIAVSLCGFILGAFGYDGTLAVQSETALFAIKLTCNIIPAVLIVIMAVVVAVFYNLEKKMPQIRKELEERNKVESAK